ncbi:MAG: response regulator transcription factor [Synergistaceae bacterium]|nr:response regulator transcription factor [Synergistaceae bacterium]MBQ7569685.1 response regulator transcription factor [Synergistaceae bacterium]
MRNFKILIVEDEPSISEAVEAYIKRAGYDTLTAFDGQEALKLWQEQQPDLIVLDLMLPKLNGVDVCKIIRAENSQVPIIMLTAKSSDADVVNGLDSGANDYVSKPFSMRVLLARIRAQLRQGDLNSGENNLNNNNVIKCAGGRIEVDKSRIEIRKDGVPVQVTKSEFLVFAALASQPIKTWSRDEIIQAALGDDYDGFDRTIDAYIKNLRRKLAEPDHKNGWINTVHGFGYRLED